MVAGLFLVLLIASLTQAVYNEDCTGAQIGKQCSFDCTKVIYCDNNGNNYTLGTCSQNETCVDGQCKSRITDPSLTCAPKPAGPFTLPFKCSDVGIFPNIMSCDRFYFCAERGQIPFQECVCGVGEVFDYETSRCEKKDTSGSSTTQCKKTYCGQDVGTCGGLPDNTKPKYAYVCLEDSGYVVPLVYMSYCGTSYTSTQCRCSSRAGKKFGISPLSTPTCAQYNASRFSSTPATTTTEAGTESWRTTSIGDKTEPTTRTKPATQRTTTTSSSSSSSSSTSLSPPTTTKTTTTTQGSARPPPPPPPSSSSKISYSLFCYMVLIVVYLWNLSCATL